jgi:hypothetical protein
MPVAIFENPKLRSCSRAERLAVAHRKKELWDGGSPGDFAPACGGIAQRQDRAWPDLHPCADLSINRAELAR